MSDKKERARAVFLLSLLTHHLSLYLKVQLEGELYHARASARLRDAAERRGDGDVRVRVCEVRPVEEVEELRSELAAHALRERDELHDGEVHVLLPRPGQDVSARVAEGRVVVEGRRRKVRGREGQRVEVLREPVLRAAAPLDAPVEAGAEVRALDDVVVRRLNDREGQARHES